MRARRNSEGWSAELRIPLNSLTFDPSQSVWGFNCTREIRRRGELVRFAGARLHLESHDPAAAGDLIGLEGLTQGLGLELAPYLRSVLYDGPSRSSLEFSRGLDLRYSITPRLTASLSYRTDFSETEVDSRQINLTRFPLFFPEKRDFFLHDAGIFSFGGLDSSAFLPYFSRRIGLSSSGDPVPIEMAAKLTGRIGNTNLGFLDAWIEDGAGLPGRNVFVGRASHNVLESSSVGGMVTLGDPNSRDQNLLAGTDFLFHDNELIEGVTIDGSAYLLGTWTEGVEGSDNLAFGGRVQAGSQLVFGSFNLYQVDENFRPALGFLPRRGIRNYETIWSLRPFVPQLAWLRRFWTSYWQRFVTDTSNVLETAVYSWTPALLELESGDEIFWNSRYHFERPRDDFEIQPGFTIEATDYEWWKNRLGFSSSRRRPYHLDLSIDFGEFYEGHKTSYHAEVSWRPTAHFSLEGAYDLNRVRFPAGRFDNRLASLRCQVGFTPRLVWKNLVQYDDISDSIGLRSRIEWEFRTGSFLQLVLSQRADRNRGRLAVRETDFVGKLSLIFRF